MRLREQLVQTPRQRPTPRRVQWGPKQVAFYPAPGFERMNVVGDRPTEDELDIDPATGVIRCSGPDTCTLTLCSAGINSHGNPRDKALNPFPPGITGHTASVYQGEGAKITAQIQQGIDAAEYARQQF